MISGIQAAIKCGYLTPSRLLAYVNDASSRAVPPAKATPAQIQKFTDFVAANKDTFGDSLGAVSVSFGNLHNFILARMNSEAATRTRRLSANWDHRGQPEHDAQKAELVGTKTIAEAMKALAGTVLKASGRMHNQNSVLALDDFVKEFCARVAARNRAS